MKPGTELSSQLKLADLDAAELADVLSSLFGGSTHVGRSEIVYPGSIASHAIKLIYDKNGLRSVVAGPGLTDIYYDEIRRRVSEELLSGNSPKVFAFTLFADVPVSGAFLYKDKFQILPSPKGAPRPQAPVPGPSGSTSRPRSDRRPCDGSCTSRSAARARASPGRR